MKVWSSRYLQRHSYIAPIEASNLSSSTDTNHVGLVHSRLTANGIVKIQLGFEDDESKYLDGLIRHLHINHGHGLPIDHSASRGWFWDIRPTPIKAQESFQARSETMENFPWHTDCSYETCPPRYFALQVLQPDRCHGGTTSFLRADIVVKNISPRTLASLLQPNFSIKIPPEFTKKGCSNEHILGSLLTFSTNPGAQPSAQLRFRGDIIVPLTKAAAESLEELNSVLSDPRIRSEILHMTPDILPRGSVLLLDNRRWLHTRKYVFSSVLLLLLRSLTNKIIVR